jgi:predicted O-methyltransferase YrrM
MEIEKYITGDKPPYLIPGGRREKGLAKLFADMGFKVGAEIGTEKGSYAETLLKTIPGLKLYCVDSWVSYETYREHYPQAQQDGFYEMTKKRLAPYNAEIIRAYSMDAVKQFADESLDFVFIDGNHDFRHATDDIDEWSKKVRKGGIVSGHDYMRLKVRGEQMHVKDVVNGYTYAHGIKPWFVFMGDKGPSWFWIKK